LVGYFAEQRKRVITSLRDVAAAKAAGLHAKAAGEDKEDEEDFYGGAVFGPAMVPLVFDAEREHKKLLETVRPPLRDSVVVGAGLVRREAERQGLGQVIASGAILPPNDVDVILDEWLGEPYWLEIQDGTSDSIASAIEDATAEEGETTAAAIAAAIAVNLAETAEWRSLAIAIGEATCGLGAGQQAAMEQLANLGIVTGKMWMSIEDGRRRPSHGRADGQVVGVSELFSVGSEKTPYPGWWGYRPKSE
jgi:hypothetical protein